MLFLPLDFKVSPKFSALAEGKESMNELFVGGSGGKIHKFGSLQIRKSNFPKH